MLGGCIDVYENEGKWSGVYCVGVYGVGLYLLFNYNEMLDLVFIFVYEVGYVMYMVFLYEV